MSPKEKKKALALLAKIERSEAVSCRAARDSAWARGQGKRADAAWDRFERHTAIANQAYADLRKLIEDSSHD